MRVTSRARMSRSWRRWCATANLNTRNEEVLVGTAATMKADDFAELARAWRSIADDELSKLDANEIYERRNLHVHTALYGMGVLNGDLDAEGTATLLEALDLACPPDATGGPVPARSLAQRRADALVDIAAAFLAAQGEGGRPPVGLNVTMDYATLTGEPPADLRQLRCELERVGPIPLETALRLACDCAVGRVVMRGESEVLDLGRQTRLVNRAPARWWRVTVGACGPAVTGPRCGATPITSSGGNTAAPPTKKTAVCCAGVTMSSATKAAGASNDATTEPTKPKNHPPATPQPGDTDAHHPSPPDLPAGHANPSSTLPTRGASRRNGLWRSLVSALVWGTKGPGFESRQPDYKSQGPRVRGRA